MQLLSVVASLSNYFFCELHDEILTSFKSFLPEFLSYLSFSFVSFTSQLVLTIY